MRQRLLGGALALAFSAAAATAASAQCLESESKFGSPDGGETSVRQLLCKVPGAATPAVRIEFQRLDSSIAGVLLEGRSAPEIAAALGRPKAVQNAVYSEFMRVLKTVGTEESLANCRREESCEINLDLNKGDQVSRVPIRKVDGNRMTRIAGGAFAYPGVSLNQAFRASQSWPEGFGMTYNEGPGDQLASAFGFRAPASNGNPVEVYLWKYATLAEFADFKAELARHNNVLKQKVPKHDLEYMLLPEDDSIARRYASLGTLPDDFFVLTASPAYNECDESAYPICCWDFDYSVRGAVLDVAVIENVSRSSIELSSLIGSQTAERAFRAPRAAGDAVPGASELADFGAMKLDPGAKLLVPLAIVFPGGAFHIFGDLDRAREVYAAKIQSQPAGTVFRLGSGATKVEKIKESFKPPSTPKPRDYAYGPEVALAGLAIDGKRIDFKTSDPSVLAMTAGSGEGSCPYLTAWNPETGRWSEFGKVLDKAKGKQLEQSQTIRIGEFRSRFRLAEREPEVAHVDAARLIVGTRAAQSIALTASDARLAASDGRYASFKWGEAIEFSFALPPGIAENDVVASELVLSGYYERYAAIAQGGSAEAPAADTEAEAVE